MTDDSIGKFEDDVVFVEPTPVGKALGPTGERPFSERAIVGMSGKYTLANWRDADGEPRVFTCTVLKMSARAIELSAPVTGTPGEWVCAHFDRLGKFEGPIIRTGRRSLVMRIVATADEISKVADKIAWIEDKNTADARRHERLVPADPNSSVMLSDGSVLPCEIIDYSVSGAAVNAEHDPNVGAVVKVGNIVGNVVRRFAGGFAVEFTVIHHDQVVEDLVTEPPTESGE